MIFQTVDNYIQGIRRNQSEKKLKSIIKELENHLAEGAIDKVLYLLLEAMSLLFLFDEDYRRNIKDFAGSYVINSKDGAIDVSAIFKKKRILFTKIDGMSVEDSEVENPISTVTFKDGTSMVKFLLSGDPDVLKGMLNNQLEVSGNLNYLFKFVYMLMLIPGILGLTEFQDEMKKAAA